MKDPKNENVIGGFHSKCLKLVELADQGANESQIDDLIREVLTTVSGLEVSLEDQEIQAKEVIDQYGMGLLALGRVMSSFDKHREEGEKLLEKVTANPDFTTANFVRRIMDDSLRELRLFANRQRQPQMPVTDFYLPAKLDDLLSGEIIKFHFGQMVNQKEELVPNPQDFQLERIDLPEGECCLLYGFRKSPDFERAKEKVLKLAEERVLERR